MLKEIRCTHCGSASNYKKGYRKTLHRGKVQKYYCKDCKKFFTCDDGFYRMRNKSEIIMMSIGMYISNLSSRKMRNQLKRHFNYKISHVSILDWVRKYTLKVHKFIEAGHIGQNIILSAAENNIGACPVSGFVDDLLIKILDLTEGEIPVYTISIGKKKDL